MSRFVFGERLVVFTFLRLRGTKGRHRSSLPSSGLCLCHRFSLCQLKSVAIILWRIEISHPLLIMGCALLPALLK